MPDENGQSLATLLNVEQRGELSMLIANTTEQMRDGIVQGFEVEESRSNEPWKDEGIPNADAGQKSDSRLSPVQLSPEDEANNRERREKRGIASSAPKIQELKSAALSYFDTWRDSVILRVGEVLNSRDHAHEGKDRGHAQEIAQSGSETAETLYRAEKHQKTVDAALKIIYPPLSTALSSLSQGERITILNAVLLLLLSLESYKAHSRVLLLRLASSLHVPSALATKMEKDIAYGLLTAASQMDGSASTSAAQRANTTARKWKVGLASVAGAALIGVTGGLAAPLVAAGVGGLMGGLGLGATAAAGYLGALAGSGVLVGGLFGAYGGKMTGEMMDAYAREVQDFAFVPVQGTEKSEEESKKRRLRVTIGVSGWLTEHEKVVSPWRVLGDGGEPFALRWELKALLALGNALQNFVQSYAWGYIKKEIIKRTVLAGLWTALMLPLGMLKISKIVDNPFSVAKARADKAGEVLADALINKAQGERPVSLVGYSLGARVIYSCLLSLAERKAFGLVDSVVVMGAPMPSDVEDWRTLRSVVSGRFINAFSRNDYILAFLYRTSSIQLGIAGLQAVEGVHDVENVDLSDIVTGHLKYQCMVGTILAKVGWPDIDEQELQQEEKILEQIAFKEEQEKQAETTEGEPDEKRLTEEAARLEKEAQAKAEVASPTQEGHQQIRLHGHLKPPHHA